MLSVNINRDIEQYQEPVAFGLNAKQSIAALLAVLTGIGITCLLYYVVGFSMEVSIYISLPFCVPIMLPALNKNHGLTVKEQICRSNRKKSVLAYSAVVSEEKNMKERHKDGRRKRGQKREDARKNKESSEKRPLS